MSNNARSGLGRLLPLLGLLVSLLWHSLASADFYQWKISIPGKPTAFFPSYTAACQYYFDNTSANWLKKINKLSYDVVQCSVSGSGGITWEPSAAILTGDSCPPEQEIDPADGACKPPPEECKEGELFPAKGPDSPVVTSGGRNYVGDGGAPTACYQSCQYGGSPSPASCYLVKGSTTTGFCNYILKGTGQSCGADSYTFAQTGDSLNPPDTPNTDPSDPNDPGCPPGWSWSGTTCVKTPTDPTNPTDPTTPGGDGDGGDGNGGGDNNGGGNDGGTGNGGDGSGGGDGNGGGDGSGDGDGDGDGSGTGGDGNGTCDPAKENCSTGPEGPGGELKEPTPGTWDDAIATWEKKVEEAKKELKTKVKANVDQMKGAFDLNLAEGGGQLPCESMTIWGKSYSLCISDYAGQLSSLRVALLLMAALIAALILLKD
ncbi:TPA: attachment protein [Pseudomonas aeruginosa]|nr:attachment protein [Pseudomonas aeruginosa]MCU8979881.1 attachment protein [Pseudomonas aeruginosa]MCU8986209.1 attachment protein [Pseudomonas aeruginosa]MCU8992302.1 attachment protein [Pseudomonas aeruginosa]MCU8998669.1 attachment protein [Pseudomonas aeruginosa]MCU9004938.1 attachment protein [Pseudomonas aeruginosa]